MKQIELKGKNGGGRVALVDDEDYERLNKYKWYYHYEGYAFAFVEKKFTFMHRLILDAPKGVQVDHVNGKGLENYKGNLRLCTMQQNQWNRRKRKGSSQYKGVIYFENKWRAMIKLEGKQRSIGSFKEERHAAIAYDLWATMTHGEFVNTNLPVVSHGP
jgi:hypothetical protein